MTTTSRSLEGGSTVSAATPLRKSLVTPTTLVLVALTLIGFYFLSVRFLHGLGAVANINSGYPWGIWVVVDVIIGTAIGCGGFAMALLVYIFNRGQYHALMRPALLSGMFGYTLGGFAVIFDLGRYWHFYNLLLPQHAAVELGDVRGRAVRDGVRGGAVDRVRSGDPGTLRPPRNQAWAPALDVRVRRARRAAADDAPVVARFDAAGDGQQALRRCGSPRGCRPCSSSARWRWATPS